jgi:hypothetical protein
MIGDMALCTGGIAQRRQRPRDPRLRQRGAPTALLIAKFHNLGKGASGAAVQNLTLMLGR